MPFLPKSLEPELHVVRHFSHLESRLIGHLHIVIFSLRSQVQIWEIMAKGLSKQVGAISEPLR